MSAPRDIETLRQRLAAIRKRSVRIDEHIPDVYLLAFGRSVRESNGRGNAVVTLDEVGVRRAKDLWHELERQLQHVEVEMNRMSALVSKLFAGPPADREMRGTLLEQSEFREALAHQRKRGIRHATEEIQPPYPKGRR